MRVPTRRLPFVRPGHIELPTFLLFLACLGLWVLAVFVLPQISLLLAMPALIFALALHSSLTHEVLHGHPFPSRWASEALVHINPGLFIPYLRFRDMHLAHHQDSRLTDPYDDPETNYLDPVVWATLPGWVKRALNVNNTLAGRMAIGPIVAQVLFMRTDWQAIRAGQAEVMLAWALHLAGVAAVLWMVMVAPMPVWAYLVSAYIALSILKIRTFLEHQAHEHSGGRTVIIEDRGLLSFLFLNNNLHVVHHMHPRVAWYALPSLYRANKARYQRRNEGYVYTSYRQIFADHFWRAKDPVPHPLWPPTQ